MKGFTEKEIESLITEATEANKRGKSLSAVFSGFALKTGRAKGSVRNFYYTLMKNGQSEKKNKSQKRTAEIINKSGLRVDRIISFSREEEKELVKKVLSGVAEGKSVRRAIIDISNGDGKLELRIQNKYRNLLKLQPELIRSVSFELGLDGEKQKSKKEYTVGGDYYKRVSVEIDKLVERIKTKYSQENEKLKSENELLKNSVRELCDKLGVLPIETKSESKRTV